MDLSERPAYIGKISHSATHWGSRHHTSAGAAGATNAGRRARCTCCRGADQTTQLISVRLNLFLSERTASRAPAVRSHGARPTRSSSALDRRRPGQQPIAGGTQ